MDYSDLITFVRPYYADKDIMHDLWHIRLISVWIDRLIEMGGYTADREVLEMAAHFHGFIYSDEPTIRDWLSGQGVLSDRVERIIRVAWESQRNEEPLTLEGKILHDAHILEGGKEYMLLRPFITGSVRGQSFGETMDYIERHVLDSYQCYLPEAKLLAEEANAYLKGFLNQLQMNLQ